MQDHPESPLDPSPTAEPLDKAGKFRRAWDREDDAAEAIRQEIEHLRSLDVSIPRLNRAQRRARLK